MRLTIGHSKTKEEAMQAVDRAMQDVFQGLAMAPLQVVNPQKAWNGSVMTFSLVAQMGFLKNPISGTVEVTDKDITMDVNLGMLSNLVPEEKVRERLETRIRGLLT